MEKKSEQTQVPHAQTLLDNAAHNEWQCHAVVTGNQTEHNNRLSVMIGYT